MKSIRKAYNPELVILVVEDYMLFAREIKHALPQHRVIFARTLEDARARYDDSLPDLTFLDIDLPDGSGFELLEHVRNRDQEAYVVILTGSKLKEDIASAEAKGARGYIIKPFTKGKIDGIIESYLDLRENTIKSALVQTAQHRQQAAELKKPDSSSVK